MLLKTHSQSIVNKSMKLSVFITKDVKKIKTVASICRLTMLINNV
jgi:hypothetical protein